MGSNSFRTIYNIRKMKDQAKEFLKEAEEHLNKAREIIKEIE